MVTLTKPDAIIFDWDNTLVDTWPIIHAALVPTFEAFGIQPWPLEKVKTYVKKSMRDAFPEVFGEDWQRAAEIYQQTYRSIALDRINPLKGSEETLNHFSAQAIPLFVVSNKKGDNLRAELAHLNWNHYFTNAVGAGDAAKDKPHPDPVWHAIHPHGFAEHHQIWFIGDSDVDLECAQNASCTAILYGTHVTTLPGYNETHLNGFPFAHHAHEHAGLQGLLK